MNKKYSKEYKERAVELSYNSDKPVSEIARDLGIKENNLYNWRKESKENPENAFTGKGTSEQEELKKMKKKIADLEVQNEILKKALAICNKI